MTPPSRLDGTERLSVVTIFGTRPEAVKMAPVVAALRARPDFQPGVVVTAQHREMLDQVLSVFRITPDRDLDIMLPEQSLTDIVTRALRGLWQVLDELRPAMVLVQGDAHPCFVGALAAYYHRIPIGHVEAGLRTDDKYQPFPEEMNRRMTSVLADLHFAPTPQARHNLLREGVAAEGIVVTGNTVIDALQAIVEAPPPAVRRVVHEVLRGHPRAHLIEPPDYAPWVHLMRRASLILTDSGGIQAEAPALGRPVLGLRRGPLRSAWGGGPARREEFR